MRCVACGEVHWNLRLSGRSSAAQECRICGAELRAEWGRRFEMLRPERRDPLSSADAAPVGPTTTS